MKIAVRPPEYMPRLSYVALMKYVDVFVVADTFQYSRQSFQNRARIRTPHGWSWITVPLLGRQHGKPVNETMVDNRPAWRSKHRRAFQYNYGNTVYYPFFEDRLAELYKRDWVALSGLSGATISLFHELFQMTSRLVYASDLEGSPDSLPAILENFDKGELISPSEVYEQDRERVHDVTRFAYTEPAYRQHFDGFEPEITAFDTLCNYGAEAGTLIRQDLRP